MYIHTQRHTYIEKSVEGTKKDVIKKFPGKNVDPRPLPVKVQHLYITSIAQMTF